MATLDNLGHLTAVQIRTLNRLHFISFKFKYATYFSSSEWVNCDPSLMR